MVLKAVDVFGSERLSQQRECSSVHELTDMAHRDTQAAELASKVHSIYIITFLIVYYILICCGYCCASIIANKSIKA